MGRWHTGDILHKQYIKFYSNESFEDIESKLEYYMPGLMVDVIEKLSKDIGAITKQKFNDGRQYYVMSQEIKKIAKKYFNETRN